MTIRVHWHEEKNTVLICDLVDRWTLDDLAGAKQHVLALAQLQTSAFYCLVDLSNAAPPPAGFLHALSDVNTEYCIHFRGMIIIGANRLYRALLQTAYRIKIPLFTTSEVIYADTIGQGLQVVGV